MPIYCINRSDPAFNPETSHKYPFNTDLHVREVLADPENVDGLLLHIRRTIKWSAASFARRMVRETMTEDYMARKYYPATTE